MKFCFIFHPYIGYWISTFFLSFEIPFFFFSLLARSATDRLASFIVLAESFYFSRLKTFIMRAFFPSEIEFRAAIYSQPRIREITRCSKFVQILEPRNCMPVHSSIPSMVQKFVWMQIHATYYVYARAGM